MQTNDQMNAAPATNFLDLLASTITPSPISCHSKGFATPGSQLPDGSAFMDNLSSFLPTMGNELSEFDELNVFLRDGLPTPVLASEATAEGSEAAEIADHSLDEIESLLSASDARRVSSPGLYQNKAITPSAQDTDSPLMGNLSLPCQFIGGQLSSVPLSNAGPNSSLEYQTNHHREEEFGWKSNASHGNISPQAQYQSVDSNNLRRKQMKKPIGAGTPRDQHAASAPFLPSAFLHQGSSPAVTSQPGHTLVPYLRMLMACQKVCQQLQMDLLTLSQRHSVRSNEVGVVVKQMGALSHEMSLLSGCMAKTAVKRGFSDVDIEYGQPPQRSARLHLPAKIMRRSSAQDVYDQQYRGVSYSR
ncbi:hypothetical protein BDR26DRAFT_863716 [Obelidium mucronatum]|nr:hypothetical protein BDR26DRAFT_863716 [Obelidium mucronatum]